MSYKIFLSINTHVSPQFPLSSVFMRYFLDRTWLCAPSFSLPFGILKPIKWRVDWIWLSLKWANSHFFLDLSKLCGEIPPRKTVTHTSSSSLNDVCASGRMVQRMVKPVEISRSLVLHSARRTERYKHQGLFLWSSKAPRLLRGASWPKPDLLDLSHTPPFCSS